MINLGPNRENVILWIDDDGYLKADKGYAINYCRFIGDSLSNLIAVDPSGGPYLMVGDRIGDKVINKISAENKGIKIDLQ